MKVYGEEGLRVDESTLQSGWECLHWIQLTQDMNQCQVPMTTVMNLRFPSNTWNFLSS
jgi:hypothetical protein